MRSSTSGARKDGDTASTVQYLGRSLQGGARRNDVRVVFQKTYRLRGPGGVLGCDGSGQKNQGDATLRNGGTHCDRKHTLQLPGFRDQGAKVTAIFEELFRMGLLKVGRSKFRAGDLRGECEHGDTVAVAVEEPVDEVEIPGAA